MLDELDFAKHFLENILKVAITNLLPLSSGWHCHALSFQAQEHGLVFKISRNKDTLEAEQTARKRWGKLLPIPSVYFSGYHHTWNWIIQERCQGEALKERLSEHAVTTLANVLVNLHLQNSSNSTDLWCNHLRLLHGFESAELVADPLVEPSNEDVEQGFLSQLFVGYQRQLNKALKVYQGEVSIHKLGWIHGDLKPDHIFFWQKNVSGIIDWEMQRQGDFLYDWAVFSLYSSFENIIRLFEILRPIYVSKGFCFERVPERFRACLLHSALGAMFMLSQSKQYSEYKRVKTRLDQLLLLSHDL